MPIVYGTTTYKHVDIEKVEKLHIDACLTGVGGGGGRIMFQVTYLNLQERMDI